MITVILKTTDGCNLRCRYCSMGKKELQFHTMDVKTLKKAGDYAVSFCKHQASEEIQFILHGGEPVLVDTDTYRQFFEYMRMEYPRVKCTYAMQTNGYLISKHFLQLIIDYNISVGISIDGGKCVQDYTRPDIIGNGSYDRVFHTIKKLREENVAVSALTVVTKKLLIDNFDYISQFNKLKVSLKINPLLKTGEAVASPELWLQQGEYAEYLISVYRYILENEIEIQVNPISDIMNALISNRPLNDCAYNRHCGKRFVCIDFKGDIYPCGRFDSIDGACVGNIFDEKPPLTIFTHKPLDEKCSMCKYVRFCNGGCSAYREMSKDEINPMCTDTQILLHYFSTEGMSLYIKYLSTIRDKKLHTYMEYTHMEDTLDV